MSDDEQQEREQDQRWMKQHNMTEAQLTEIKECFVMFDVNGDGVVASALLGDILRTMAQNPTEKEVADLTAECDKEGQGVLTLEQLVDVIGARGLKSEVEMQEELEEAMKVFDKLGAGYIRADELRESLNTLGEPIPNEEISEMLKLGNVDPDGKMNYYDLINHLCSK